MKRIRCKDYHIIKIRHYADQKLLDKHHREDPEGPYPRQHHERGRAYFAFQLALIEHVTGLDNLALFTLYQSHTMRAGMEDVEEKTGIRYSVGEGWETYMIPKDKTDLIEWFHNNITANPFKVVKRTHLGYLGYREFPTNIWREIALKHRIDFSKYKTGQ